VTTTTHSIPHPYHVFRVAHQSRKILVFTRIVLVNGAKK
jgi:hypothetical protein